MSEIFEIILAILSLVIIFGFAVMVLVLAVFFVRKLIEEIR